MKIECLKNMWKLKMQRTEKQPLSPAALFLVGPQLIYFGIKPRAVLDKFHFIYCNYKYIF